MTTDEKIHNIGTDYILKTSGLRNDWPNMVIGSLHDGLSKHVHLEDGELVLLSAYLSHASWYVFTTRRIIGCVQGKVRSLDPSHGILCDFPNFKGYDPSDPTADKQPGVIVHDLATITAEDTGTVVVIEYETWDTAGLPQAAARYWETKHPFLHKLITTQERVAYAMASMRYRGVINISFTLEDQDELDRMLAGLVQSGWIYLDSGKLLIEGDLVTVLQGLEIVSKQVQDIGVLSTLVIDIQGSRNFAGKLPPRAKRYPNGLIEILSRPWPQAEAPKEKT